MKKVITLCLCLMLIVSCIAPTALADNAVIQVSGSTALDGDYDSVADYFTSYLSAAAQLEGPMTVTLLDDVEISGNTPIMLSNTDNETPSILDLNGHTITVSGSIGVLVGSTSRCPFIIKNGTMVDYAKKRIKDHIGRFTKLYYEIKKGTIDETFLKDIEKKDAIFPFIDYMIYF